MTYILDLAVGNLIRDPWLKIKLNFPGLDAEAGLGVVGVLGGESRDFDAAAVGGVFAARGEGATGDRLREVGRHAGNGVEFGAF